MFPHFFSRVNAMGAPVTGMIILGVVQTLLALMTISPTLSEQFSALVNLSVVTNVVPYIIALSALMVMMRTAGVPEGKYRFNTTIATIGMALQRLRYLRVGQGCCPRRHARHRRRLHRLGFHCLALRDGRRSRAGGMRTVRNMRRSSTMRFASFGRFGAWLGTVAILMTFGSSGVAQTLDRIRNEGAIKLGYVMEERPFSFQDDAGAPTGYAVSLCTMVVEQIKGQLGLDGLALQWVPLDAEGRLDAVRTGAVDLLCGANTVTLTNRETVSYSISIFPSGTGALVRNDAQLALREVLVQGQPSTRPIWRGSPARTVLEHKTFSAVAGTTSESWLNERIRTFHLDATVVLGSQLCRGDRSRYSMAARTSCSATYRSCSMRRRITKDQAT